MSDLNNEFPSIEAHKAKGDWNPLWDTFADLDPEFLEAYLTFRSVPQNKGSLPQKTRELILIAINAATTHLYGPGVRRHVQNALKAGATQDEILETIQLTTLIGIHSCNLAIPILLEEVEKFKAVTV
ncbi:MAG: alkylhydroperoxidase/carboxymuconolactone decarboxylase family protein YurZ [Gammaproteobacteria bacterium]|jgi:alkylhydroperoxidase/carboxymuconolactone decarboxylase family protein YurZ